MNEARGGRDVLTAGGLFDGIGLLAYGLHRAGLEHRWLCEIDPFRRQVLARRSAMRVERSRLSALGDGVQVQLGEMVGRFLNARASRSAERTA